MANTKPYTTISTKDLSREQWLELRRTGIGGSDVATICGLNPYRSLLEVYMDKIGELPPSEHESEAAYWGTVLEDIVAQEFSKRTGLKVQKIQKMFRSKQYPFMIANIDRLVTEEDGTKCILECKTTSVRHAHEWDDGEVPVYYLLQVQHYLAVTGFRHAYIAVLIGGQEFRYSRIERDDEMIRYLIDIESDFWRHVEAKEIPREAIDGSELAGQVIQSMFKETNSEEVLEIEDDQVDELLAEYRTLSALEKDTKQKLEQVKNQLKFILGEHEVARRGETLITWKAHERTEFDDKAFAQDHPDLWQQYLRRKQVRSLRIQNPKLKKQEA